MDRRRGQAIWNCNRVKSDSSKRMRRQEMRVMHTDPTVSPESESTTEPGPATRVLIVDDHVMIAEGLRAALGHETDIEVVGVAHDVAAALELMANEPIDVVLMDYIMPTTTGLQGTRRIKRDHPDTKVILLTGYREKSLAVQAMEEGCDGFLRKTASVDEVAQAVRDAQAGEAVFSSQDLMMVARSMRPRSGGAAAADLTARELEVLHMLTAGMSTDAMAQQLFVSSHTIRSHVRSLLLKLDAHSKLEAVAIATRAGLIEPSY
jgi:DNA-binding NarL/FixJ family response regulator